MWHCTSAYVDRLFERRSLGVAFEGFSGILDKFEVMHFGIDIDEDLSSSINQDFSNS